MSSPFNTLTVQKNGLFCILLLTMLLCTGQLAFSQKVAEKNGLTFRIQKAGNTYAPETVIQTLEAADLRFHRFQSAPNVLVLDDFTEIEILPAESLAAAGLAINPTGYRKAYPDAYAPSTFRIHKYILLEHRPSRSPDK